MTPGDVPGAPLEELCFLARSPNRVRVLDALTRGPMGRYELEEETGVARATLGRILDDLEARGWATETDRQYEATRLGAYVSRELAAVLERFEPVPVLNDVAQWLPDEEFDVDLGHLAGADVVRPTTGNALAPTAHLARRIRGADSARLLTYSVLPDVLAACWRGTVEGSLSLETVLETGAIEGFAADPRLLERAREIAETGQSELYVYDDDVPATVFVVDEFVLLCLSGGTGAPQAVVETTDPTVREWAETTIDDCRAAGERVDPTLLTG